MKVEVSIAEPILHWVLNNVQLNQLPPQIADYLLSWYSGEKIPTYNQIEKVSNATGIPLGYFFLQTPPVEELPLLDYRTIDSHGVNQPSRELIDTMHDMDLIQEWTRNHMIAEGNTALSFVGILEHTFDILTAANTIRNLIGLKKNWFKECKDNADSYRYLRSLISNLGVIVMMNGIVGNNTHRPLSINEFRAFAIADEYAPLIFINTNDSYNGKLFSLLHEFVHICLGKDDLFNDRDHTATNLKQVETLCNAVTAEILVPIDFFIERWSALTTEYSVDQTIRILAKEFRCGPTVIARRAFDQKYITSKEYQEIARLAVKLYNERRKREKEDGSDGGNYYRTAASRIDHRFFEMLSNSVAAGRTLYSDAFRLTNTNRTTFFRLAEAQIGGGTL